MMTIYPEITVSSQQEFDALPKSFEKTTRVLLKNNRFVIGRKIDEALYMADENSEVSIYFGTVISARKNAKVFVYDTSIAYFFDKSNGVLRNNSKGFFHQESSGDLFDFSCGMIDDHSTVRLFNNSIARMYKNTFVEMYDNTQVEMSCPSRSNIKTYAGNAYVYINDFENIVITLTQSKNP